jgi:hypothetical protein
VIEKEAAAQIEQVVEDEVAERLSGMSEQS